MKNKIRSALDRYFGFSDFRFGQDEIILSLMSGNDTLAVMPTGGGKSLCYQLPAVMLPGTAIVISPLIALMKDQVDSLEKRNYPATFINSSLSFIEIRNRISLISEGKIKLLYLAPERLESKQFLDLIQSVSISFLAVDEAHCISEWGHDFRPSYLSIPVAFAGMKRFPIIALTATATPEVQTDITKVLGIPDANKYIRGFDRPNLSYKTIDSAKKTDILVDHLKKNSVGSSIIYCGSRKRVNYFHEDLITNGIKALKYHAGMTDEERKSSQDKFINSDSSVIVATNAFGMGIDKPNVRNVVHLDYTMTIEAYYQEAGRAGRDNIESDCIMLHNQGDINLQHFFIKTTHPERKDIIKVYNKLYDIAQIALGDTGKNAIYLSEAEIANLSQVSLNIATSVLKLFEKEKIIIKGSSNGFGKIKLTRNRDELFEVYNSISQNHQEVLEALLRDISREAFRHMVDFDIEHLIGKYDLQKESFNKSLNYFQSIGILNYFAPSSSNGITLIKERMDDNNNPVNFELIDRRREHAYKKFDIVRKYALTQECKRNFILNYFGETDINGKCGKCTSCLTVVKSKDYNEKDKYLMISIINSINELSQQYGRKLLCDFMRGRNTAKIRERKLFLGSNYGSAKEFSENDLMSAIQEAISSGYLISTTGNYPVLKITDMGRQFINSDKKIQKYKIYEKDSGALFARLQALREKISNSNNIPSRSIISDKMLRMIAKAEPADITELLKIEGLSQAFCDNFGSLFLQEIKDSKNMGQSFDNNLGDKTNSDLLALIKQGLSFNDITRSLSMTPVDAAKEIQIILETVPDVHADNLIDKTIVYEILNFLTEYPSALLRDVRTYFGSKNDMPTLRLATAIARKKLKTN